MEGVGDFEEEALVEEEEIVVEVEDFEEEVQVPLDEVDSVEVETVEDFVVGVEGVIAVDFEEVVVDSGGEVAVTPVKALDVVDLEVAVEELVVVVEVEGEVEEDLE